MSSNPTEVLLDFSTPFDQAKVTLLDQVVQAMYSNNQRDVSPFFHIWLSADGNRKPDSQLVQVKPECLAYRR